MKTKAQIMDDIDYLINIIQKNKMSSESQSLFHPNFNKEILTIRLRFYIIADSLTSEFTEQELYKIENNLLFYHNTLRGLIDYIARELQTPNAPTFTNTPEKSFLLSEVKSSIIKQEDIDEYTNFIQRRIEGIKIEIEKNQKMQLRHLVEIYSFHNELADNLDQQMMSMDEQLYVIQTQRQEATIKNIINDLDGV